MSNFFNGVRNFVSYTFNSLDQTSAANDIIVVKHRDGTLHSSPFNVRFGKAKVIQPRDKVVTIEVNGAPTSAVMKMGDDGVAFWLVPTSHAAKHQGNLSSPLQSPTQSPTSPTVPPHGTASAGSLNLDGSAKISSPVVPTAGGGTAATTVSSSGYDSSAVSPAKVLPPSAVDGEIRAVVAETDGQVVQVVTQTDNELPLAAVQHYDELLASLQTESGNPMVPSQAIALDSAAGGSHSPETSLGKSGDGELANPTAVTGLLGMPPIPGADDSTSTTATDGAGGVGQSLRLSKFASSVDDVSVLHNRVGSSVPIDYESQAQSSSETDFTEDDSSFSCSDSDDSDDDSFSSGGGGGGDADGGGANDAQEVGDGEGEEGESDDPRKKDSAILEKKKELHYKRSFQPLLSDLTKLNLKPGCNTIKFNTNSRLRGSVSITANIFLWNSDTKIVVSDIDGTVTKSDVWGHLLPRVGKDWTHPGICDLYDQISKNGYEFLYVTARSVSQIEDTKRFIFSIRQKGVALPQGPLITAPDRLWDAITQEVGHRSHEFKIACLKSVSSAFPKKCNPFFAGFGNRIGDVIAYGAANIPKHKILIIDASSALHVASLKGTYSSLAELVDMTFPPVETPAKNTSGLEILDCTMSGLQMTQTIRGDGLEEGEHVAQQYTSWNYWNDCGNYFPPEEEVKKPGIVKKIESSHPVLATLAAAGLDALSPSGSGVNSIHSSPHQQPEDQSTNDTAFTATLGGLSLTQHRDPNAAPDLILPLPTDKRQQDAGASSPGVNAADTNSLAVLQEGESPGKKAGSWFTWGRKSTQSPSKGKTVPEANVTGDTAGGAESPSAVLSPQSK